MDVSQWHNPPLPEPLIEEVETPLDQQGLQLSDSYFDMYIDSIKTEVEKNLGLPIATSVKVEYLDEIITFFKELDNDIFENEDGRLESNRQGFTIRNQFSGDRTMRDNFYTYLVGSKEAFRDTIIWLHNKLESIIPDTSDANNLPQQPKLVWNRSDTDLLELVVSLYESGAVQNPSKDLSQKGIIEIMSSVFGKEIKDIHKKLNAARNRKKDDGSFINKLQTALEEYYHKLDDKL